MTTLPNQRRTGIHGNEMSGRDFHRGARYEDSIVHAARLKRDPVGSIRRSP